MLCDTLVGPRRWARELLLMFGSTVIGPRNAFFHGVLAHHIDGRLAAQSSLILVHADTTSGVRAAGELFVIRAVRN